MSELEDQLRRLKPRTPPATWRDEILAKCARVTAEPAPDSTNWRDWFWPAPLAWAALAAIWLGLGLLQHAADRTAPAFAKHDSPPAQNLFAARREVQRLLTQL